MKVIEEKGGLSGKFKNHSGKLTCATQLHEGGGGFRNKILWSEPNITKLYTTDILRK